MSVIKLYFQATYEKKLQRAIDLARETNSSACIGHVKNQPNRSNKACKTNEHESLSDLKFDTLSMKLIKNH